MPRAWISIGPVAVGDARASVEASLGRATSCYPAQPSTVCYEDGTAYLSIAYAGGHVRSVSVSAAAPSMPGHATRVPRTVRFSDWRLDRQPALAARFDPDRSWTVVRSAPERAYSFGGYLVEHGVDRQNAYSSVSLEPATSAK